MLYNSYFLVNCTSFVLFLDTESIDMSDPINPDVNSPRAAQVTVMYQITKSGNNIIVST